MGKFLLSALLAVLLSLEQGGLSPVSCNAASEAALSQRWHFLGQVSWHHWPHRQKPRAGALGHVLWRSLLQRTISLTCSLHFTKVIAQLYCPMVVLLSWLYLPTSCYSGMVFFCHRAYCLFEFMILNTRQTLLWVLLAMLPSCVLCYLISAQQAWHCPLDMYSLPTSQALVSLALHILQSRIRPSGWRSPLGWPGWAGLGLQGSRSFVSMLDIYAVQNTRLTNLTVNAYESRWWWAAQLPGTPWENGML